MNPALGVFLYLMVSALILSAVTFVAVWICSAFGSGADK